MAGDLMALESEEHDDCEKQSIEGNRADLWEEALFVPDAALRAFPDSPGQIAGHERDAKKDGDRSRDEPDRYVQAGSP